MIPFQALEQGGGQVLKQDGLLRLLRPSASLATYSNAQVDDYRAGLSHQAPLVLEVRARFSHPTDQLRGTGGFGFWNAPFAPGSARLRFPKAAWFFFGSAPLDLPLVMGVAGRGFLAMTLDATRWPFFALLPTAPLGFLLMRQPVFYRRFWPIAQRTIRASAAELQHDITQTHDYRLEWRPDSVAFYVDGSLIHQSPASPSGRMGFVAWLDNQYAIATPQGRFAWGMVEAEGAQWLDIQEMSINKLA